MIDEHFLGLSDEGFADRVGPFVAAGVLEATDVHVVDLLARRVGGATADVLLALAFAVRAPGQGSAGVHLESLAEELALHRLGLALPDAEAWVEDVRAATQLVRGERLRLATDARPFVHDGSLLMMSRYARHQEALAAALLGRRGPPSILPAPHTHAACLAAGDRAFRPGQDGPSTQQRLAAQVALDRSLLVLSGGPGTGTIGTVRGVLLTLRELFLTSTGRLPRVAIAVPTGKAAVHMTEALHADTAEASAEERGFLASLAATTVHALLRVDPARPVRFEHDAASPLPADVVIVGEASKLDLSLMAKLAAAVRPDARLVLVGDHRQLAPVGAGSVLADSIAPEATALAGCLVELDHVDEARAGSLLARLWAALDGTTTAARETVVALLETAVADEAADLAAYPHVDGSLSAKVLDEASAHHARVVATVLAGTTPEAGTSAVAAAEALRRLGELRVLTPHREGRLGVSGLSERLAHAIAPAGYVSPDGTFPGTPLLVLENRPELGLANGDVGVLCRGSGGRVSVAFSPTIGLGPPRFVDRARLPAHEPCFAMTVHKSQGSQYETVVLVLPDTPSRIVTRELVYTALTRARERFVLAGSPAVFRAALDRRVRRASSLSNYLDG